MSWRSSPPNEWYSTGTTQLSMVDHTTNAIKAIDAEIDSVLNDPKKNPEYKATAVKHWEEKKAKLLKKPTPVTQISRLTQISREGEVPFQCKEESPNTEPIKER